MPVDKCFVGTLRARQPVAFKRNANQRCPGKLVSQTHFNFVYVNHPIQLSHLHDLSDITRCVSEVNFATAAVQLNQHTQNTARQVGRLTKIYYQLQAGFVADKSRKRFVQIRCSRRKSSICCIKRMVLTVPASRIPNKSNADM
jgi:hypothetical protein